MATQTSEKAGMGHDHRHGPDDFDEAVQLAHEAASQKSSPWTAGMFRLYGVLAFAYLCGCLVRAMIQ